MPESALSLVIHLTRSLPGSVLAIDRRGLITEVNDSWRECGIAAGLSARFEWTGTDYFELMRELVLPSDYMSELLQAIQSIFLGERLVYSGRFPMPPFLRGGKWFQIEALPIPEESNGATAFVLLSHRYTASVTDSSPAKAPVMTHYRKPLPFVPICASCKSVRKGGQWVPIERFLQQELHVELTHDICPSCIAQLYPQYARVLNGLAE
ncbi:hypothetical protein G5B47_09585 [Paenibacillus sp. 7124]|uniref:PAS domain-containing protein n=1 Tax=Paenibacillus apii TaxID=1850370 RepID=A0A6M1PGS6_9BACL|nr:hypothetical protein [Paenibacillus apii]NGM82669.1 hypothetical protein [Paenibacillus apii]NJJ39809.1 hypothetical protein [Paenibacillus apii]